MSSRGVVEERQKQIPSLRCGMTNKRTGKDNYRCKADPPPLRCGMTNKKRKQVLRLGSTYTVLRRLDMAREIDWMDAEEIGILLQETYPEIEPYSVRFTDLHKYVIGLPGFVGDPGKSNEGILEAIQTAWNEEWEDAK
jgi:FeS assembly protein IscX